MKEKVLIFQLIIIWLYHGIEFNIIITVSNTDYVSLDVNLSSYVTEKRLQELLKNQIIIAETNPDKECVWFEIKSSESIVDTDDIILETTTYDDTKTFHADTEGTLETVTNMTEDITSTDDIIVEDI